MHGETASAHPSTHTIVALVARGGCMFEDKARHVQLAGDIPHRRCRTHTSSPPVARMRISVQPTLLTTPRAPPQGAVAMIVFNNQPKEVAFAMAAGQYYEAPCNRSART